MKSADIKAISLSTEINLNKIASHFGVTKKFKWEETLVLNENNLKGIIKAPSNKFVYIYHFGSAVFINITHHEIMDIINYLKEIEKSLNNKAPFEFIDDFSVLVKPNSPILITYETLTVPEAKDYYLEILSTVLAKSVALEKIEAGIEILTDEIEDIVEHLDKNRFNVSGKQLSKTWSRILRFRFNTISYIMLLDRPDITWTNKEAGELFDSLSSLFELEDRYNNIQQKTQTLSDITQTFENIASTKNSAKLEWLIIILIAFEIAYTLAEKFLGF